MSIENQLKEKIRELHDLQARYDQERASNSLKYVEYIYISILLLIILNPQMISILLNIYIHHDN